MPKKGLTRFLLNALLFACCLFVNFIQNSLAKSIAKRIVIIFKHAVEFLYIFAESNVAVTVQLNNIYSFFCKLHHAKIFQKSVADSNYITTSYAFYTRRCVFVHFRRK